MEKKKIVRAFGNTIAVALIGASVGIPLGISYTAVNDKADYVAELRGRYEGRTGRQAPEVSLDSLETLARNAGIDVDSTKLNYKLNYNLK